jgi:hypothetical protein
MQKNTKICLILPRIPYKQSDFDYLETFTAPLMGTHTNLETAIDNLFVDRKSFGGELREALRSLQIIVLYLHAHVRVVIRWSGCGYHRSPRWHK